MSSRRALLAAAGGLTLSGCGFRPLYGPVSHGALVAPQLASIYVAVMAERDGQLLRQALQQRLEGTDDGVAKLYELTGGLGVAGETVGIQQDSSATRVRLVGNATWFLRTLGLQPKLVTSGTARVLDGYNINNQQYFAADLEASAASRRIADSAADKITLDLATYFRQHPDRA